MYNLVSPTVAKQKLQPLAMALIGSEKKLSAWWTTPHVNFGLASPDEVLQTSSGYARVKEYLEEQAFAR